MKDYFAEQEAQVKYLEGKAEEATAQAEEATAQAEEAKAQAEEAKRQAEEAKAQTDNVTLKYARFLLRSGLSIPEAAQETGLGEDVLRGLGES